MIISSILLYMQFQITIHILKNQLFLILEFPWLSIIISFYSFLLFVQSIYTFSSHLAQMQNNQLNDIYQKFTVCATKVFFAKRFGFILLIFLGKGLWTQERLPESHRGVQLRCEVACRNDQDL